MPAFHLLGFLDFLRGRFLGLLIQAMGADDEGFDRAARVPEGEEAVGMIGGNDAEFVDAIRINQFLEILDWLAALELADTGSEFLQGVFFQRFQEVPRFRREYRNNGL